MSQPRFYVVCEGPVRHWVVMDRETGATALQGTSPTLDWRSAVNVSFSQAQADERALELNCRFDGWHMNQRLSSSPGKD
jgi:hypothetical protein